MRLLVQARNTAVGVEEGRIVPPAGRFDAVIRVPDGDLRPGLINAHDHLHRNHYGRLGRPPYRNAYDWGRDIHARHADAIARGRAVPPRQALLAGAWKNLLAGVTTVVHHDPWEDEFARGFPLRVARVRCAHSLGFERGLASWAHGGDDGAPPRAIHLAEGVDLRSAAEVRELAQLRPGALGPDLLAVHVVGADADGVGCLRASGCAVVWCPSSNLFLFGATAPAALLAPGIDVLLGSDSLLTGAGTLLDELRCARELALVTDDRLLGAVGATAAHRLGVAAPSLDEGAPADLAIFRRPVLEAGLADVAAVIVAGVPRVLDPALAGALGPLARVGRQLRYAGVTRWVLDDDAGPSRADGALAAAPAVATVAAAYRARLESPHDTRPPNSSRRRM